MKIKLCLRNISLTFLLICCQNYEIIKGEPQIFHLGGLPPQQYTPWDILLRQPIVISLQNPYHVDSSTRAFLPFLDHILPFVPYKKTVIARLSFEPGSNANLEGTLYFYIVNKGILIEGEISGLTPGLHGFHIHQNGSTGNKCADAGAHFNPRMSDHGSPRSLVRHVGDLGNIEADFGGVARFRIFDSVISFNPYSEANVGGLSVVVHANPDDLGQGFNADSLKTGNAGGREGCGIISVI